MINKKILLLILLLPVLVSAQDNFYYSFEVDFSENAKFKEVELVFDLEGLGNNYYDYFGDNYRIKLFDKDENLLIESEFSPVMKRIIEEVGIEEYRESEGMLVLPYFENAYSAVIYDTEGNEIDSVLVSQYSRRGFDINDFNSNVILDEDIDQEIVIRRPVEDGVDPVIVSLAILLVVLIGLWVVLFRKKQ